MYNLKDLPNNIDILRNQLECLIIKKEGNLIDNDILAASKILNDALNQYDKLKDLEKENDIY